VPIACFGQIFKSAAAANGFVLLDMPMEMRWIAHRFLHNFPSWTFSDLMIKYRQDPPLDELIQQAIEEQCLHPQDVGTGRYQHAVSFWNSIGYSPKDAAMQRSKDQEEIRSSVNPASSGNTGMKCNFPFAHKDKQEGHTELGTAFVPACYGCCQPGHIHTNCPERAAKKAKTSGTPFGKKGKPMSKQLGTFLNVFSLSS